MANLKFCIATVLACISVANANQPVVGAPIAHGAPAIPVLVMQQAPLAAIYTAPQTGLLTYTLASPRWQPAYLPLHAQQDFGGFWYKREPPRKPQRLASPANHLELNMIQAGALEEGMRGKFPDFSPDARSDTLKIMGFIWLFAALMATLIFIGKKIPEISFLPHIFFVIALGCIYGTVTDYLAKLSYGHHYPEKMGDFCLESEDEDKEVQEYCWTSAVPMVQTGWLPWEWGTFKGNDPSKLSRLHPGKMLEPVYNHWADKPKGAGNYGIRQGPWGPPHDFLAMNTFKGS